MIITTFVQTLCYLCLFRLPSRYVCHVSIYLFFQRQLVIWKFLRRVGHLATTCQSIIFYLGKNKHQIRLFYHLHIVLCRFFHPAICMFLRRAYRCLSIILRRFFRHPIYKFQIRWFCFAANLHETHYYRPNGKFRSRVSSHLCSCQRNLLHLSIFLHLDPIEHHEPSRLHTCFHFCEYKHQIHGPNRLKTHQYIYHHQNAKKFLFHSFNYSSTLLHKQLHSSIYLFRTRVFPAYHFCFCFLTFALCIKNHFKACDFQRKINQDSSRICIPSLFLFDRMRLMRLCFR